MKYTKIAQRMCQYNFSLKVTIQNLTYSNIMLFFLALITVAFFVCVLFFPCSDWFSFLIAFPGIGGDSGGRSAAVRRSASWKFHENYQYEDEKEFSFSFSFWFSCLIVLFNHLVFPFFQTLTGAHVWST